ncbi:glycoside hydrolase family 13 protein, partial [Athelia psychrophila]
MPPNDPPSPRAWWKSAVVYQIYPISFCDTNADGLVSAYLPLLPYCSKPLL